MEKTELEILVDCKRYCEARLIMLYDRLYTVEKYQSYKNMLNEIKRLEKVLNIKNGLGAEMEVNCNEKLEY